MGAGEFTPRVARMIWDRDHGRCFYCRKPLKWEERGYAWSIHHRKPRGMGSSSDPTIGSVSNGVALCGSGVTGHHGYFEKHRDLAIEYGLLISRNATTEEFAPAAVRVRRQDGSFWLLTESGRAVEVEEGIPL